jgi:hypothetical protein
MQVEGKPECRSDFKPTATQIIRERNNIRTLQHKPPRPCAAEGDSEKERLGSRLNEV